LPSNFKIADYNPFLEHRLLRLCGSLQCSDLSRENAGSHRFKELPILQTKVRLHHFGVRVVLLELRTEFWIVRGRQTIKRVLHACLPCKISNNRLGQQIEARLPADRVRPSRPLAVIGVDFASTLYVRAGRETQRAYIARFTCATTRAGHLELCTHMTTAKFLMALQRFFSHRGLTHTVYSDNAKTFEVLEGRTVLQEPPVSCSKQCSVEVYCTTSG
jgi:hypothetical protein